MENNLIRPAFESTRTEEEREKDNRETFNISINKEQRDLLNRAKFILQQEKDSTAMRQMFEIGLAFVEFRNPQGIFGSIIKENLRRNKRLGISEVEIKGLKN